MSNGCFLVFPEKIARIKWWQLNIIQRLVKAKLLCLPQTWILRAHLWCGSNEYLHSLFLSMMYYPVNSMFSYIKLCILGCSLHELISVVVWILSIGIHLTVVRLVILGLWEFFSIEGQCVRPIFGEMLRICFLLITIFDIWNQNLTILCMGFICTFERWHLPHRQRHSCHQFLVIYQACIPHRHTRPNTHTTRCPFRWI